MPEQGESIADALGVSISNLPMPAQVTFFKAISRLTGGLIDIPAAYLDRWSQSIRDTTSAKSLVSQSLARSASKELTDDQLTMEAVKRVYVPEVIRKTRNRIEIAKKAAEEIQGGAEDAVLEDPEEDWINTYSRWAEDASSERMQRLFAKILAGEMQRKGSFSTAALRIAFELNQTDTRTFQEIWAQSCGEFIPKSKAARGAQWVGITKLRDMGLLSPVDSGIWQPDFQPMIHGISPWWIGPSGGRAALVIGMKQAANKFFNVIGFTQAGLELARLFPEPDYNNNLRELGLEIADSNVSWIALISESGQEMIQSEEGATVPAFRLKKP